jgi:DNA-directed RNA polymerase specialized sigma subunit
MACQTCPRRHQCSEICREVQRLLPAIDRARLNFGHQSTPELKRTYHEMMAARTIVGHRGSLRGMQLLVVNLYYNDFLSQLEISRRLDISQKTVHTYLARAHRKIRNLALR